MNIVLFASGNGSNVVNILNYSKEHEDLNVVLLVTDNANAPVIEKAKKFDCPVSVVPVNKKLFKEERRRDHEENILQTLNSFDFDWICLGGYMRIFTKFFIDKFYDESLGVNKILNIHPSLLPSFPGINGYQQAYDLGVKVSGVTIHLVDCGVDTGPILMQESFNRHEKDTFKDFLERGLTLEHSMYPEALEILRTKAFKVTGQNVVINRRD
jgi:phosphoribosylglycinamide formyltransferase-1